MKRLLRDRKGMSLPEVIVSFAIVAMVMVSAISLMMTAAKADAAYRDRDRALIGCENAKECIRFADGNADLLDRTLLAVGFENNGGDYILEYGHHTVTVTVDSACYAVRYNGRVIYEYTASDADRDVENTDEKNTGHDNSGS